MKFPIADDLSRAEHVIRMTRLTGPSDPVGVFSFPKDRQGRQELADFVFDLSDQWAARAVLDAPTKHRVVHQP